MSVTEATRERPILFSGEMVRAIREDRKTQTRRVIKPQPDPRLTEVQCPAIDPTRSREPLLGSCRFWLYAGDGTVASDLYECPYGRVGDWLWVRETWSLVRPYSDPETGHVEDIVEWTGPLPKSLPDGWRVWYAADGDDIAAHRDDRLVERWRPSIHLPRWACRLALRVTSVKVERLTDISEADAIAEGFNKETCGRVLRRVAGKTRQEFGRWIELPDGSELEGYWCLDCVEKEAKKRKGRVCGWNDCFEADSAPYCNKCGVMLYHSLTRNGIETELDLTDEDNVRVEYTPKSGDSALCLAELAEGMGDWSDEFEGRLAQIGFGTIWDEIHGKGAWKRNDWVWVVSFERVA